MIRFTCMTIRGRGQESTATEQAVEVRAAMSRMAKVELGMGGQVVDLHPDRICIEKTTESGIKIATVITGSQEEMQPLFELATFFAHAGIHYKDLIVSLALQNLTRLVPEDLRGNPLILSMLAPDLLTKIQLRLAVMLAHGLTDEADFRAGIDLNPLQLHTAVESARESKLSLHAYLALREVPIDY